VNQSWKSQWAGRKPLSPADTNVGATSEALKIPCAREHFVRGRRLIEVRYQPTTVHQFTVSQSHGLTFLPALAFSLPPNVAHFMLAVRYWINPDPERLSLAQPTPPRIHIKGVFPKENESDNIGNYYNAKTKS
jgi:hypothetical protein